MAEENTNLDKKVEDLEAAAKKYASKDTVIAIGGYEFTPAKLMIAFGIVSSVVGGMYGAFETYKDYQGMKKKIAEYVSPDLEEVYKKLDVIQVESSKTSEYTRDIKNDLKGDIRRVEGVVEGVERSSKQSQREAEQAVKEVRQEVREVRKDVEQNQKQLTREVEQNQRQLLREVDSKIQKALDNPLANGK